MDSASERSASTNDLSLNERIEKSFEDTILQHRMLTQGISALGRLYGRGKKRMSSRGLLLAGESRSGKSTLFRYFMEMYPPITHSDLASGRANPEDLTARQLEIVRFASLKRVIKIELKVRPSRRSISADIHEQLTGSPPRDRQYSPAMLNQIRYYGNEMGTELLLVDEAHHAINSSNEESTEVLSEYFKSLQNIAPFQIAYAGLPKLLNLEKYAQFKERLEPTFLLTPYDWMKKSGRVEFCALLGKFDLLLRLPKTSGLATHALAKRMYVASLGEVGIVSKLLSAALLRAHEHGMRSVDTKSLGEVFEAFAPSDGREDIEEDIDFDAQFEAESDVRTFRRVAPEDNPFLCEDKRLRELWMRSVKQRSARALRTSGRETRMQATGAKPAAPF